MIFTPYTGPNAHGEGFGRRLTFTVYGIPMPKGSYTKLANGHVLDGRRPAAQAAFKQWTEDVQGNAFMASTNIANRQVFGAVVFEGPVNVCAQFYFPRPKHESKAERLRTYKTSSPDLDKLLRGVLDPMKKAGIYRDDAQVCGFMGSEKLYVPYCDGPQDILEPPRVEVYVSALQETE